MGVKRLKNGTTKTDLSEIIPGSMVNSGSDLKRLEKLNHQLKKIKALKEKTLSGVYDDSLIKTIDRHV